MLCSQRIRVTQAATPTYISRHSLAGLAMHLQHRYLTFHSPTFASAFVRHGKRFAPEEKPKRGTPSFLLQPPPFDRPSHGRRPPRVRRQPGSGVLYTVALVLRHQCGRLDRHGRPGRGARQAVLWTTSTATITRIAAAATGRPGHVRRHLCMDGAGRAAGVVERQKERGSPGGVSWAERCALKKANIPSTREGTAACAACADPGGRREGRRRGIFE